jgi:GNAT superfamily N-acetyltransferase
LRAEPVHGPEPLSGDHDVDVFECGVPSLNDYLARQALHDQRAEKARTYVIARGPRVVGYFSLAAASVEPADAAPRAAKGQGHQPIPAILLARLAVDAAERGQGFGEALLVEALGRAVSAADAIGARVVVVHAMDEEARAFYAEYGFEPSPTHALHLMVLMKDIRATFAKAE